MPQSSTQLTESFSGLRWTLSVLIQLMFHFFHYKFIRCLSLSQVPSSSEYFHFDVTYIPLEALQANTEQGRPDNLTDGGQTSSVL